MIGYNDLYDFLRKEKYSEALQLLSQNFLLEFSEHMRDHGLVKEGDKDLFSDQVIKTKKQFENAISIFKELMLKRKKKILNLVFVATETGIMKKDYENMLPFEREVFDKLVKSFEEGDKKLSKILSGQEGKEEKSKMVLFKQDVEQFVDHQGKIIGPFKLGELANLDSEVAGIIVSGEKASFVDEG